MRVVVDKDGRTWGVSADTKTRKLVFRQGSELRLGPWDGRPLKAFSADELNASFAAAGPGQTVQALRDYSRTEHPFFDELVAFCVSASALGTSLQIQASKAAGHWGTHEGYALAGTDASGISLTLMPYQVLEPLAHDQWPDALRIVELKNEKPPKPTGPTFGTASKLSALIAMGPFVWYFEKDVGRVRARFGRDVASWPGVWNFARVARNAMVHHEGQLHFDNPNAEAVTWRHLTYAPDDNGKKILMEDLGAAELILLMEDMHAALVAADAG